MTVDDRSRARPNQLFEALSRPHRRRILCLLETELPSGGDELAPSDADERAPSDIETAADSDVLLTDLHRVRFPNLEGAGYIRQDEGTVRRGPRFDEIAPLLQYICESRTVDTDE